MGYGLGWRYADDPTLGDEACSAVVCLIGKREVVVSEARFGGVVAEPLRASAPGLPSGLISSGLPAHQGPRRRGCG